MTLDPKTLEAVEALLSANGCDCDCEHHHEEHGEDCARCLACRVDEVLRAARVRAMAPKVEVPTRTAEQERADERERVALAFEASAEHPDTRAHAKCLRASAAFVRALGPAKGGA